jgi:hypothetical protein
MAHVARLVTRVELEQELAEQLTFSARHEAVLEDGRRLLLLDDRGWSSSLVRTTGDPEAAGDVPGFWAVTSAEDIEETSRVVVGPDEAFGGRSQADMERDHWANLAGILREQGIAVEPDELKGLPHDVVLSETILSQLGTL